MTGPDTLKLVAPAALLPKLAERVRAVKPLLLAALEEGNRKAGAAQLSGGGVLNPRRAAATVQHLTVKSSSDRAIPTSAVDWPARYHEALARRSAFHPRR